MDVVAPSTTERLLAPFRRLFTRPTLGRLATVAEGVLLAAGPRTVAAALRAVGKGDDAGFASFHRVLNAARWSARDGARLLLLLIVGAFVPEGPVVLGLDDTIERRKGSRITAKGIYRDPVRSSKGCFVKVSGLRWLSLMVVARVPFARAVWGLPFLTVLCPSERAAEKAGKRHKKLTDWARQALLQATRWLPGRTIVVVADSGYAVIELCLALVGKAVMISRLRLDARLFEPAPPRRPGQIGRPRRVGRELPKLAAVLASRKDGRKHRGEAASGTAVWYHPGSDPLPLRWVLVRRFDGNRKTEAFFSTDPAMEPGEMLRLFALRWQMEVTFSEVRKHLGVETQRPWSDLAIARATPMLLGLFSLVAWWAATTPGVAVATLPTAWYRKTTPTFADALATLRLRIWEERISSMFRNLRDNRKSHDPTVAQLAGILARAA
ncbi:MAG TPA: transposase [Gaiellaceae bacterium]|nr:transposase [Gaiellaceae bacterium]